MEVDGDDLAVRAEKRGSLCGDRDAKNFAVRSGPRLWNLQTIDDTSANSRKPLTLAYVYSTWLLVSLSDLRTPKYGTNIIQRAKRNSSCDSAALRK